MSSYPVGKIRSGKYVLIHKMLFLIPRTFHISDYYCHNACQICDETLTNIYIVCAECQYSSTKQFKICVKCFASGVEINSHLNDHSYYTINNCFKIATGCRNYLDLNGFDSYSNICQLPGKEQYNGKHFTQNVLGKDNYTKEIIPYLFRIDVIVPPRCELRIHQNSLTSNYQFARSDFDIPFDGSAENILSQMITGWDSRDQLSEIQDKICSALILAYNNRLR